MVEALKNIPDEMQTSFATETLKIVTMDGVGPITMGVGGSQAILATAVCLLNDPQVNKFLLAQKLKMTDRMTKTKIFPREGMALPDGETYHLPEEDVKEG